VRYLRREQPAVLLAVKPHPNLEAVWARQLAGVPTRLVIGERDTLSQKILHKKRSWRWRYLPPLMQRVYLGADAIIAVSDGVADDLSLHTGIPRERITTVYNPVVTPELLCQSQARLDHPWFMPGSPPVVLGVGRLAVQKDFPTLLRTFARVRAKREARLMILGGKPDGKPDGGHAALKNAGQRAELIVLASKLGIAADVALPGFVINPFAYMARARVFVLSSAWEGLPGVLIQALACGCPVVSTDCPNGPAEILAGGAYGPLVPVGDDAALAAAIESVLDVPPDPERLRQRAAAFSVERAMDGYLDVLLGAD
jgi:glycosyltransferase involved in cell wall biosynthesis